MVFTGMMRCGANLRKATGQNKWPIALHPLLLRPRRHSSLVVTFELAYGDYRVRWVLLIFSTIVSNAP